MLIVIRYTFLRLVPEIDDEWPMGCFSGNTKFPDPDQAEAVIADLFT